MSKLFKVIDRSTYSQRDSDRTPNVLEFVSDYGFSYKIHRHIDYPNTWLLTCRDVGIEQKDLSTNIFDEAKEKAEDSLISVLATLIEKYRIIVDDLNSKLKL